VTIDSSAYTAQFNNRHVGVNKPVTVLGVALGGADAGNYTVSQPAGLRADITPASLTVTGAVAYNKTFDHSTAATVNFAFATVVGVLGADDVTLDPSAYTAAFDTEDVGAGKPVTVTGLAIVGADIGNYTLTQPTMLTADILGRELSFTANNKPYDATTMATLSPNGILPGDDVTPNYTADFDTKDVGSGKPVTVTGLVTLAGRMRATMSPSSLSIWLRTSLRRASP